MMYGYAFLILSSFPFWTFSIFVLLCAAGLATVLLVLGGKGVYLSGLSFRKVVLPSFGVGSI